MGQKYVKQWSILNNCLYFAIKYLRSLGFSVNNELFEHHSWYFRNALVRANYRNVVKGIERESIFLIRFFRNLLLGEKNILKNRATTLDSKLYKSAISTHNTELNIYEIV